MKLKGKVVHGLLRGEPLIERLSGRIQHILKFKPHHGTLDIKLEKPIDIKKYEKERIERILLDGTVEVEARLAPIKIFSKNQEYDCWAIGFNKRMHGHVHHEDILEVISKDKLPVKEGDEVEIELFETKQKRRFSFRFRPEKRLMR